MNILLLGGAGFIGTNFSLEAINLNYLNMLTIVESLDDRFNSITVNLPLNDSRVSFIKGSILDQTLMNELVLNQDCIINLAAQTSHIYPMQHPLEDAQINILGNLCVLEAVRNHNPRALFVYTSTSTVVGSSPDKVITENNEKWALDIYSSNKGTAENHCNIYSQVYGLKILVLRFANLYGTYGKKEPAFGFINHFISQISMGNKITIYSPGSQLRNVMHVRDAVNCIKNSLHFKSLFNGTPFFAASNEHLTVLEIANLIVEVFQRGSIDILNWPEERKKIEVGNVQISCEKLRSASGWQPIIKFIDGLKMVKTEIENTVKKL